MLSNQTLLFSDSSPADASRTRQLMPCTTTSRDTWGGCHRGNPHSESEATPQPSYSPEHESVNVSLPPCCVPAVGVLRCTAFILSVTILFLRLHFL